MDSVVLRLLILVTIFGAVMLVVELFARTIAARRDSIRAVNQRMKLIASGMSREKVYSQLIRHKSAESLRLPPPFDRIAYRLEKTLSGAGLTIPSSQLLLYISLGTILLIALPMLLFFASGTAVTFGRILLLCTFAVAVGFGLPLMFFARRADKRRYRLQQQFPVALDVFVRGLRAGHPVASALELLTTEMTDPIGSEFGLVVDEMTYGADMRDALQNMADRCGVEDMQMFVVSLSVQSETGGNLAEILENLSKVIRDRHALLLKVRALSSEGRMTGLILTALPILAFSALFLFKPSFYLEVAGDPIFVPGFAGLLILYSIGFYTIRRLIDLKV